MESFYCIFCAKEVTSRQKALLSGECAKQVLLAFALMSNMISNCLYRGGCHSDRPHVPACDKVYFNLNESVKFMVVDGTCRFLLRI